MTVGIKGTVGKKDKNKLKMALSDKSKPKMKERRPKKKAQQSADAAARSAIANGEAMKDEIARKTAQDARTLYIRFSEPAYPKTADEVKELHSDIKFVRTPRVSAKGKDGIGYAFLEFGNPEECKAAKNKLSTKQFKGKELYVDFVGENSKGKKAAKPKANLNPTRLFVVGLNKGITKTHLKEMFPKAANASIPPRSKQKGTSFGFVQFSNPADAKAAFDAAQDLTINNHKISVFFAKVTDKKDEKNNDAKAEKRKATTEEEEGIQEAKKVKKEKKKEAKKKKKGELNEKAESIIKEIKEEAEKKEVGDDDDEVDESEEEGGLDNTVEQKSDNNEEVDNDDEGDNEEADDNDVKDDEEDDDDEDEEEEEASAEKVTAAGEENDDDDDDDDEDDEDDDDDEEEEDE